MHGRQHDHDDRALTMKFLIRHLRSTRGQALVEFALVLPIFAIMLFGIIDLGRYVFTANSLNNSAREAAQFASVVNTPRGMRRAHRIDCAKALAKSAEPGDPGELGRPSMPSAGGLRSRGLGSFCRNPGARGMPDPTTSCGHRQANSRSSRR